jgi:hypothetical protein
MAMLHVDITDVSKAQLKRYCAEVGCVQQRCVSDAIDFYVNAKLGPKADKPKETINV